MFGPMKQLRRFLMLFINLRVMILFEIIVNAFHELLGFSTFNISEKCNDVFISKISMERLTQSKFVQKTIITVKVPQYKFIPLLIKIKFYHPL